MPQNSPLSWTSYAVALLGLWLLFVPPTFGVDRLELIYSDLICGALLLILSRYTGYSWVPWAIALIGAWLGFAPLLFWAKLSSSYLNDTVVGALAVAFSILIPALPGQPPEEKPSIPPGWSYNPSAWSHRLPIALLAFFCWMLSRYLAAYQLGYIDFVWDPFFGEGTVYVITSKVSKMFPVPDAGLGAFAYTLEFLLTCQGGENRWRTAPWMVLVFGVLAVPASLVSILLIILQPLVVGAWCSACLLTAFLMLLLVIYAVDEVAATLQYLRHSKEKPFWALLFQGGKCPSAKTDERGPAMNSSLWTLFKASLWGVGLPWNLGLSTLLGIWLMFNPWLFGEVKVVADLSHLIGALTVVCSMLSWAEVLRSLRWVNCLFGLFFIILAFFSLHAFWSYLFTGALLFGFSLRRGKIYETYTIYSP